MAFMCIAEAIATKFKSRLLTGLLLIGLSPVLLAEEILQVSLPGSGIAKPTDLYYFYIQAFDLALSKTRATDGDYKIVFNDHGGGFARDKAMLMAGVGIDAMWLSATKERRDQLQVIDIDLLKGLNNYRVLVINPEDQERFNKVKTLQDLKQLKVGVVMYWTDGTIMKDNGFKITHSPNYLGLFKMLAARRFDFVSRGLHENGVEVDTQASYNLVTEKTILLKYDVPVNYCFFVNKNNKKLADRLERGLKLAQKDGSFDELFAQIPGLKHGEEILYQPHRNTFVLNNFTSN